TFVRRAVFVRGDDVVHLVAHLRDKFFNHVRFLRAHADKDHVLEFFLHRGQVRDARAARPAPRRPKFHHHDLLAFECGQVYGFAFDPFGNLQRRGGITELRGKRGVRKKQNDGERPQAERYFFHRFNLAGDGARKVVFKTPCVNRPFDTCPAKTFHPARAKFTASRALPKKNPPATLRL
ncbi:MAG: hypothetical protein RL380_445, partial [Verrucomicrobiota bacterium]